MPIRVLIADDQPLIRAGFRGLLESSDGIEVVGEAANGEVAVECSLALRPDVVIMDVRMPVLDGLEATRRITSAEELTDTRVLVLTTFDFDEYVFEALRAGASGFLLKDATADDLIEAVRVIASGDALLAPAVTRRIIERFARAEGAAPADDRALESLTPREREVLALVAKGLSNDGIAERLVMSPATAKTHVSHVMTKLGARDRAQLVTLAYETGLVSPGP